MTKQILTVEPGFKRFLTATKFWFWDKLVRLYMNSFLKIFTDAIKWNIMKLEWISKSLCFDTGVQKLIIVLFNIIDIWNTTTDPEPLAIRSITLFGVPRKSLQYCCDLCWISSIAQYARPYVSHDHVCGDEFEAIKSSAGTSSRVRHRERSLGEERSSLQFTSWIHQGAS